jgi:hypothetical protein
MTQRIRSALNRLNELIDEGCYFHAALTKVAAQYRLDPFEGLTLTALYSQSDL